MSIARTLMHASGAASIQASLATAVPGGRGQTSTPQTQVAVTGAVGLAAVHAPTHRQPPEASGRDRGEGGGHREAGQRWDGADLRHTCVVGGGGEDVCQSGTWRSRMMCA
jgi:hypothetical protein